jgi:chloramphenicol O-acetyltransferase type A
MAQRIDIESWPRRAHFELFRGYEQPFFNICAEVDVTDLRALCRKAGRPSFFISLLWLSLAAANGEEAFRLRLEDDEVLLYPRIHGSSTILRRDESFAIAHFAYQPSFRVFAAAAEKIVAAAASSQGELDLREEQQDVIHYSVLPWLQFTSFTHARPGGRANSIPKIVFGKYRRQGERDKMPISVEVHHALMDGLHVSRFLESFQELLGAAPQHLES